MKRLTNISAIVCCTLLAALAFAQTERNDVAQTVSEQDVVPYILDICPISKHKLGSKGDPIVKVYEGREIILCRSKCDRKFKKKPEESLAKLDKLIMESQLEFYPRTTCVITGRKLVKESPYAIYQNTLVRFCCMGCVQIFKNNPEPSMTKLAKSVIAKQSENYPLTHCPVSGEELGSMGEPIELVYAGRLVKLCCKMCIPKFEKDPMPIIEKINAAWKTMHSQPNDHSGHNHGG